MIKLDVDLLVELGLGGLSPDDKKRMLNHIYETLEMRVGMELAKQMSDAQLTEFEQFINRNDEAGALRWLETNFPDYKQVVANEFEKLKGEIKQVAPQILQDAMSNPAPAMPAASQPPQQPVYGQMPPAAPQQYYDPAATAAPAPNGYATAHPQQYMGPAQQPQPMVAGGNNVYQPQPMQQPGPSTPIQQPQTQATPPQQQPYAPSGQIVADPQAGPSDQPGDDSAQSSQSSQPPYRPQQ